MHRLRVLLHHIVGDIHNIVDRTDAVRRQTALHPHRGRTDFYILYNPADIAAAKFCILDFHRYIIRSLLAVSRFRNDGRYKFFAEGCRRLARDAEHAEAVHAVARDLILKIHIVQPQRLHCVRADLYIRVGRIAVEYIKSLLRRVRIHLPAGAKLLDRAHHAEGLHAAQLPFFYFDAARCFYAVMTACHAPAVQHYRNHGALEHIRRARHDLHRLARLAHLHLTDHQLIRIRVPLHLKHFADHNLFQVGVKACIALHLCAGQCHRIRIFLRRAVKPRHVRFNPRKRCIHR